MPTPQSDLISEVNGSLWKNRYFKVLYDKTVVQHIAVVKALFYTFESISQVDKVILSISLYNVDTLHFRIK